ncbi:MAG: hypothetical protein Q9220_001157 [cf. Caloplaca sp. 1 TL-2023]
MLRERYRIDIAELMIYSLLLPGAIWTVFRHRFPDRCGFIYLCAFCALRIAGSIVGIISERNISNLNNLVWADILGAVGLGPLLLASFSLITRVNRNSVPSNGLRTLASEVLHLPNIVALILSIVGGVYLSSGNASQQRSGKQLAQAGILMFMSVFALFVILCFITVFAMSAIPPGERHILYGVLLTLPLIFLRILYSVLADFLDNRKFAVVNGSATVQLLMAVVEEIVVVVIYIFVGLSTDVQAPSEPKTSRETMRRIEA